MDIVDKFTRTLTVGKFGPASDDLYKSLEDGADRWNFSYSVTLLSLMAVITTTNIYIFKSFECTILNGPLSHSNIASYIQALCWAQGTVALRSDESMPETPEEWRSIEDRSNISFYQWVPFCLALQAILFYLPHLVWTSMASRSFGCDINNIFEYASDGLKDIEKRNSKYTACAEQILAIPALNNDLRTSKWAKMQRNISHKLPGGRLLTFSRHLGNWVTLTYLLTKCLYIINLIGQLHIIRVFLTYGRIDSLAADSFYSFTKNLFSSVHMLHEWDGGGSIFFPRKTFCKTSLRHFGYKENVYVASCALPVNIYTEKMYIFLWIWIILVLTITIFNIMSWFLQLLFVKNQEAYVSHMLSYGRMDIKFGINIQRLKTFTKVGLKPDGLFILKMISKNLGSMAANDICVAAWNMYFSTHDVPIREHSQKDYGDKPYGFEMSPHYNFPDPSINPVKGMNINQPPPNTFV